MKHWVNRLMLALFSVSFTIHIEYNVDIHAVARGIALMGGMMQTNALAMAEQHVLLEYSIGERSVKHNLKVVGHGHVRMRKESCISIYGGENLEKGSDHDFGSIATNAKISQYTTLNHSRCSRFRYQRQGFPILNNDSRDSPSPSIIHTSIRLTPDISFLPTGDVSYINSSETQYVVWTNNGTGVFDVFDRQTGRSTITASFKNYKKDGEWTEYYDFEKMHMKLRGTYSENVRHGTFRTFFNGEALVTSSIKEYSNGRLNGVCVCFGSSRHITGIKVYNSDVLEKYISYYPNGVIHIIITMNGERGNAIELTEDGYLRYFGEVVLRKGTFEYEGKGTLFFYHLAELSGEIQNNHFLFDGRRFYLYDCLNGVRIENGRCVVCNLEDGTILPWKLFNIDERPREGYLACNIDGKQHVIEEIILDRQKGKTKILTYGIGGYLIRKRVLCGNKKKETFYFPLPGEGGEYRMKGITVNPFVARYVTSRRKRSKRTMSFDNIVQDADYHNYDEMDCALP